MSEESGSERVEGTDRAARQGPSDAVIARETLRFLRYVLKEREEQVALIAALLPELEPLLESARIDLLDGSFVDDDVIRYQFDVAMEVRLANGEVIIVYVVFESRSDKDPMLVLQMLRYQSRLRDRYIADHPGTTPGTVPAIRKVVIQ